MSEGPFGYFNLWDFDGDDSTQWQQIFDHQTLEANGEISYNTYANGNLQHKALNESTPPASLETRTAHGFDERLLDPAPFPGSSNVPWPTIEEHEPILKSAELVGASVEPAEEPAAHQSSAVGPILNGDRLHQHQDYADSNIPWSCAPRRSDELPGYWGSDLAVQQVSAPAPVANMEHALLSLDAYGVPVRDHHRDRSRSIVDPNSCNQDLYDFTPDLYNLYTLEHIQSGPGRIPMSSNMPRQTSTCGQDAESQTRAQPYPQGSQFNDVSFTHVLDQNIQSAYRNQSFFPDSFAAPDASFSPNIVYSPDVFSPTPGPSEFSPGPDDHVRRPRSKTSKNPNAIVMKQSINCVASGCGKAFKIRTNVLDLCSRCAKKHDRRTVEAQPIELDPNVPDISASRKLIFPAQPGRGPPITPKELTDILANENRYIQRLLDAINEIVPGGEGGDLKKKGLSWEARQQITLNQTLYMEGPRKGEDGLYRRSLITARLRALFREMYQFHTGITTSQECFYPVGGANAGYNADTNLDFHERFEKVHEYFRKNKRMVMDVIEGRGVKCIVSNPMGYNKRKVANNACNEDKKEIMGVGKERIELEGSEPPRKRRRRGKQGAEYTPDYQLPENSEKQTRRDAPERKVRQSADDLLDAQLREALDAGGFGVGGVTGVDERSRLV